MSSSSSSSPIKLRQYDVFLSFSGKDTRDGFTSHLHDKLIQKKIETFIDYELQRGDEISPALLTAIEESKILVVIFSRNYASSKWCLDELEKIMGCKKSDEHYFVVPVFYHIDPSEVRHQRGSFAEAFAEHEEKFKDDIRKVKAWRTALTEAANLVGWDSQVTRPESTLVDEIVNDILKKLNNAGWIENALSQTTLIGEAAKNCMEKIWAYLMDDNIRRIGVWGMGGIGKTSIMMLVHDNLVKEAPNFGVVRWITVSKEMSIIKLQNKIAKAMDVTLDEDEDETIRARMIRKMLARKGKYVLILDDLWDELSLEKVGIPESSNGSKILVTTRLSDVCRSLDCRVVKVPTLSKADGLNLFLEKVGQDVSSHPDLLPLVESVAEECAGLPLAIVTIASSMKGVDDVREWRNALHELKGHVKSVNNWDEKVFQQLKFSYDRLQDENVKHCFLCCALFPEDFEIYPRELINLWIEEGLVEEMDSMQIEIDRGHTILNKLKRSCLIEDSSKPYSDGVKLHDVVRDMAIRITSVRPRFLVRSGMQLGEITAAQDWDEVEKASFMENWRLQIPSQMPPLKCQNLTTLLLSSCNIKSIPECFFEQMHGLKVLDLSQNTFQSLPNSISNLEDLTTLLLCRCERLEKVPSFSKLQALKKLDLTLTKIKEIPDGMERLVNLKFLKLSLTYIKKIPDGILGKLTALRYLALRLDTLVRGEEIGGLRKLELYEGGKFYDLEELNDYARASEAGIKTPSKYSIRVGACTGACPKEWFPGAFREKRIVIHGDIIFTDDGIKVPSDVEQLTMDNCTVKLCEEGAFLSRFIPTPPDIFSSLSHIVIWKCKNIRKLFSSTWVSRHLQNLEHLDVMGCEHMEEIIALESELEEERISLPKIRWLSLKNLPELKSICGANGAIMVGGSNQQITISNCPKLKRIPLNLPLQDDGQPSPPPSLRGIWVSSKEWWESLEWDHPNDKSVLEPKVWEIGRPAHFFDQNSDQDDQDFDQNSDQDDI